MMLVHVEDVAHRQKTVSSVSLFMRFFSCERNTPDALAPTNKLQLNFLIFHFQLKGKTITINGNKERLIARIDLCQIFL